MIMSNSSYLSGSQAFFFFFSSDRWKKHLPPLLISTGYSVAKIWLKYCMMRHMVVLVYQETYFHIIITYLVLVKDNEANLPNEFYFKGLCSSWNSWGKETFISSVTKLRQVSFIGFNNWVHSLTTYSFTDLLLKRNIWRVCIRFEMQAIHEPTWFLFLFILSTDIFEYLLGDEQYRCGSSYSLELTSH